MILDIVQIVAAILNAVLFVESVNTVSNGNFFFFNSSMVMIIKNLFSPLENVVSLKQANSLLVIDLLSSLLYGMWRSFSWLLITNIQEN